MTEVLKQGRRKQRYPKLSLCQYEYITGFSKINHLEKNLKHIPNGILTSNIGGFKVDILVMRWRTRELDI